MKRIGGLLPQVTEMENLRVAFYKAQRGNSGKAEVVNYREHLSENLLLLQQQLLIGKVNVGKYKSFIIYEPKERKICSAAFEERVLHHALLNICAPVFERHLVDTTYANRKRKGVYKALDAAHVAMSQYMYVAKLDVRKYFDTIDHSILKKALRRLMKEEPLLAVWEAIIDSYEVTPDKGLPIGNLTSQYCANYYLSGMDHYAKEQLKVAVYVRYMDDILLFGTDRQQLLQQTKAMIKYAEMHLNLLMKPPIVCRTTMAITFLGYRLRGRIVTLAGRSRRRFTKKYRIIHDLFQKGVLGEIEYQMHLLPLFAFVKHGYTKQYRKRIIQQVESHGVEPCESWW
ncbi:MAG: RNA-directed DNA polymerase [Candidatus Aphodosoma sp.]